MDFFKKVYKIVKKLKECDEMVISEDMCTVMQLCYYFCI